MDRRTATSSSTRRGVVLILILAMLSLLAIIGVSFATFSGQARYATRTYTQKLAIPDPESLIDFGMSQLINDSTSPMSAIYGHSFKRDLYGNDALNHGSLTRTPSGGPILITANPTTVSTGPIVYQIQTNLPTVIGIDISRWVVTLPATATSVAATYEVVAWANNGGFYQINIAGAFIPSNPINHSYTIPFNGAQLTLASQYLRGMNGPGIGGLDSVTFNKLGPAGLNLPGNLLAGQFANFRIARGLLDPAYPANAAAAPFDANALGMDEDYDAADLENWFLALQSADGEMVVPSFHRPGILTAADWTNTVAANGFIPTLRSASKILTPRGIDHGTTGASTFPPLVPDPTTGKIQYPVDNDGDGITDSVWLDLGYRPIRSPDGKLYKPLFSFMVVGLNGRMPLNTAGNLNGRMAIDDPATPVGNELGLPLFDHASHLGYSPSEINPKFGLQNAIDLNPASGASDASKVDNRQFQFGTSPAPGFRTTTVDLTQLRNLLTGTRRPGTANGETDTILVEGVTYLMPNNVADDAAAGGNFIPRATEAVSGRWGEPDGIPQSLTTMAAGLPFALNVRSLRGLLFSAVPDVRAGNPLGIEPQPVRAGRSPFPDGQYRVEAIDENFDGQDFYPTLGGAGLRTGPETGDLVDASNRLLLASERIRRFLAPIDPTGNGRLMRFRGAPTAAAPFGTGVDDRGRIGFLHYYRPPGVSATYVPGSPTLQTDIPNSGTDPNPSYVIQDSTLNVTHAYDAFRDPDGANGEVSGAMPYNASNNGDVAPPIGVLDRPTNLFDAAFNYVGTFDPLAGVNSQIGNFAAGDYALLSPVNGYGFGGLRYNDPDEMDLYRPSAGDSPFGVEDLEYLYRGQDVDGSGLASRLADLVPVSFELSPDRYRNRRLYTTETWDRIAPAFANDNPGSVAYPTGFAPLAYGGPGQTEQFNVRYTKLASPTTYNASSSTVNLLQGDRRINLNFPLPHSYDPRELTRLKWISETYALMKRVVPPHAIDTPQELAKLGQYVVNIIDFRDPDNTMTIWVNPDVRHMPARRTAGVDLPPSIHMPYRADGTVDPAYTDGLSSPLVHYGFEYNPIAINEVLGFQFEYADTAKTGLDRNSTANRLFIELVNTLTKSDIGGNNPWDPNPSNLDLEGWDFVLVREDPQTAYAAGAPYFHPVHVRPDPVTGQIPATSLIAAEKPVQTDDATVTVAGQSRPVVVGNGEAVDVTVPGSGNRISDDYVGNGLVYPVPSVRGNGDPEYYVMAGLKIEPGATAPAAETNIQDRLPNPPANAAQPVSGSTESDTSFPIGDDAGAAGWDLIPPTTDPALVIPNGGMYFWLYLRRPADTTRPPDPDPASATYNPLVVVDSMRFPFNVSGGRGETRNVAGTDTEYADSDTAPTGSTVAREQQQPVYSVSRYQPYRGGQIVPSPYDPAAATDPVEPLYVYGTSEQARPTGTVPGPNEGRTLYDDLAVANGTGNRRTTDDIRETLGAENSDETWDHIPFNDRDFMSVAELMLVSTSPPGMFTKQFCESLQTLPLPVPEDLIDDTPADNIHDGPAAVAYNMLPTKPAAVAGLWTLVPDDTTIGLTTELPVDQTRAFPHLPHEFYYSSDPSATIDPLNNLGAGVTEHVAGGPTSAGWYRALEFFEVPTPTLGAIGPVSLGVNFDWYRESQRPGQVNLNLIVDEEVFFGVVDDPRMLDLTNVNSNQLNTGGPLATVPPQVVTQVDPFGTPSAGYPLGMRPGSTTLTYGFTLFQASVGPVPPVDPSVADPTDATINGPFNQGMKPAFSDFVKQRHGGSGFIGAYGMGLTGSPYSFGAVSDPQVARDRPYRSLSYFDIQSTLMRPGTLDPSGYTAPPLGPGVFDPGLRNGTLEPGLRYQPDPADPRSYFASQVLPAGSPSPGSPILAFPPPRRWLQVPDTNVTFGGTASSSAAALDGLGLVNTPIAATNAVNTFTTDAPMTAYAQGASPAVASLFPAVGAQYLGGSDASADPFEPKEDLRRHPLFQTELLQKMSNLTTVRTHQYAVWLTVGLFEVTKTGDPAKLIPDTLGREIGASAGSNSRYRSFFIVDRTRATGFNPYNPGDHRELIVYRRRIE